MSVMWGPDVEPVSPPANPVESHLRAEQAIVHGEWPFVCPYCSGEFKTDRGTFPYCSDICAINAQND